MKPATSHLPLVYACSGCSSVAQLANDCAVRLDREGFGVAVDEAVPGVVGDHDAVADLVVVGGDVGDLGEVDGPQGVGGFLGERRPDIQRGRESDG